jgi:hypothetical protein
MDRMLHAKRFGWLARAAVGLLIGSLIFGGASRRLILAAEAAACATPAIPHALCREAPNAAGFAHGFFRVLRKAVREAAAITWASALALARSVASCEPRPAAMAAVSTSLPISLQRLDVRLQV